MLIIMQADKEYNTVSVGMVLRPSLTTNRIPPTIDMTRNVIPIDANAPPISDQGCSAPRRSKNTEPNVKPIANTRRITGAGNGNPISNR